YMPDVTLSRSHAPRPLRLGVPRQPLSPEAIVASRSAEAGAAATCLLATMHKVPPQTSGEVRRLTQPSDSPAPSSLSGRSLRVSAVRGTQRPRGACRVRARGTAQP